MRSFVHSVNWTAVISDVRSLLGCWCCRCCEAGSRVVVARTWSLSSTVRRSISPICRRFNYCLLVPRLLVDCKRWSDHTEFDEMMNGLLCVIAVVSASIRVWDWERRMGWRFHKLICGFFLGFCCIYTWEWKRREWERLCNGSIVVAFSLLRMIKLVVWVLMPRWWHGKGVVTHLALALTKVWEIELSGEFLGISSL